MQEICINCEDEAVPTRDDSYCEYCWADIRMLNYSGGINK